MAHSPTTEQVAERVGEMINKTGVTVVWLCEATGIPRSTMIRRLNGHTAFDLNELDRIAQALRIPVTDLLSIAGAA